jgi:DNA-binding XRE family transcriptional regulator
MHQAFRAGIISHCEFREIKLVPLLVQRVKRSIPVDLILYLPSPNRRLCPRQYPQPATIGERIRQYRIKNCLSQSELSSKLQVSKARIYRIENNITTPNQEIQAKIAKILKVDVSTLTDNSQKGAL